MASEIPQGEMTPRRLPRPVIAVGVSCCLLLTLAAVAFAQYARPLVYVKPGTLAVVVSPYSSRGYRDETLQPGVRFLLPGERIVLYPTSPASITISLGGSDQPIQARDGRSVSFDATVVYSIDPNSLLALYVAWQARYESDLVEPLARGVARDVVAQYWPEQVVMPHPLQVEEAIATELRLRLSEQHLVLEAFTISNARHGAP